MACGSADKFALHSFWEAKELAKTKIPRACETPIKVNKRQKRDSASAGNDKIKHKIKSQPSRRKDRREAGSTLCLFL